MKPNHVAAADIAADLSKQLSPDDQGYLLLKFKGGTLKVSTHSLAWLAELDREQLTEVACRLAMLAEESVAILVATDTSALFSASKERSSFRTIEISKEGDER